MSSTRAATWLSFVSLLTIVIGLVAAFGAADATDAGWAKLFDILDWPIDDDPSGFDTRGHQLNAVLGGVMAGWGALMFSIVRTQFAAGDHRLARPMITAVLLWFVVDSAGSVVAGLPGNVVLNVSFVALFVPPLLYLHSSRVDDDASAGDP